MSDASPDHPGRSISGSGDRRTPKKMSPPVLLTYEAKSCASPSTKTRLLEELLPRGGGVAQSGSREAFRSRSKSASRPRESLEIRPPLLLTSDAVLAQSRKYSHNSLHLECESCETRGGQTSDVSLLTALWLFTNYQPGAKKRWYAILYVS